jgi:serine/threonine protein kinase
MIVTEFAGNGSLANHLPPSKCCLSGATRITRVIVGIALAMRFLHSRGITHCDFKPDNILLEWIWNGRIADFGRSSWSNRSKIPSLTGFNMISNRPSNDLRYIAPECCDGCSFPESNVFSFGPILYELLTGPNSHSQKISPRIESYRGCIKFVRLRQNSRSSDEKLSKSACSQIIPFTIDLLSQQMIPFIKHLHKHVRFSRHQNFWHPSFQ